MLVGLSQLRVVCYNLQRAAESSPGHVFCIKKSNDIRFFHTFAQIGAVESALRV